MKKIIFLLLCCGVLMSMVGCGGNGIENGNNGNTYRNYTACNGGATDRERKRASSDRERGSDNRADCDCHRVDNNGNGKAKGRNQT